MRKTVYFAIASLLLLSCGKDNKLKPGEPIVTSDASSITFNSAILCGYVNIEYLPQGGECGFIVSTSSTPSLENGKKVVPSEVDSNGKYTVQVNGLTSSTSYYYRAFLNAGTTNRVGEIRSFTTKEFVFAAIDIGLSVKWANANLGATSPEDFGDYYAWGETEPKAKSDYNWSTYKWCNGNNESLTKYNHDSRYGTVDNKWVLEETDDAAHVKLGGEWRIPTSYEADELILTKRDANYKWEWTAQNGQFGFLVTYLVNNNSIFFPAAGYWYNSRLYEENNRAYIWTSLLSETPPTNASYLFLGEAFDSVSAYRAFNLRSYGSSIRPVSN